MVSRAVLTFVLIAHLLAAFVTTDAAPQLTAPAYVPPLPMMPASFGLNTHLATRYPDPSHMDIPADTVAALGVTWVREDLHWHRIQPSPMQWDWTFTDAAILALHKRGIQILGVLGPAVGWATPYGGDGSDAVSFYAPDPDAFVRYAQAVVQRYGHIIHHWEIWNEPDSKLFWLPQPDPAAYANLLIHTSAAIKAIDSTAQVLNGGVYPFDLQFLDSVIAHGAWPAIDILAIHPYIDPEAPDLGGLSEAVQMARGWLERDGMKPIWVTEFGWASGPGDRDAIGYTDETIQASYMVRAMLTLWGAGVERSFWYMLKDDAHNPYGLVRFGTGRSDYAPLLRKPAFTALQSLVRCCGVADTFRLGAPIAPVSNLGGLNAWSHPVQGNGVLVPCLDTACVAPTGDPAMRHAVAIRYGFDPHDTTLDYLVFERSEPITLRAGTVGLNMWVYGDNSGNDLKLWIRDAEGETLQYELGVVGAPGWTPMSVDLRIRREAGDAISGYGNRRLDMPAQIIAVVLDHRMTGRSTSGTIFLDAFSPIAADLSYHGIMSIGAQHYEFTWRPTAPTISVRPFSMRRS